MLRVGANAPKKMLTITEVSKVAGASILTKNDIREQLGVPVPLTQNQNVNELELNFKPKSIASVVKPNLHYTPRTPLVV